MPISITVTTLDGRKEKIRGKRKGKQGRRRKR